MSHVKLASYWLIRIKLISDWLAGGTMQPIHEFRDQLFVAAGAEPARVMHFSCDHVVPATNILPRVLTSGPSGARLDFSYQHRDKTETLTELGRVLTNIVTIVPGKYSPLICCRYSLLIGLYCKYCPLIGHHFARWSGGVLPLIRL